MAFQLERLNRAYVLVCVRVHACVCERACAYACEYRQLTCLMISTVYYKTKVGTWRFREALKKLMHNSVSTTFIVICLIF